MNLMSIKAPNLNIQRSWSPSEKQRTYMWAENWCTKFDFNLLPSSSKNKQKENKSKGRGTPSINASVY